MYHVTVQQVPTRLVFRIPATAVLGAGLLFVILAAIMVVTRKVDWYRIAATGNAG